MSDNDPKHTSGLIKDWLKRAKVKNLPWPPYSPHFNPIESLWDEESKKHQPKTMKELELL